MRDILGLVVFGIMAGIIVFFVFATATLTLIITYAVFLYIHQLVGLLGDILFLFLLISFWVLVIRLLRNY